MYSTQSYKVHCYLNKSHTSIRVANIQTHNNNPTNFHLVKDVNTATVFRTHAFVPSIKKTGTHRYYLSILKFFIIISKISLRAILLF